MATMLQIHEKIKQARVSAGLSQAEMAEKLGIERSTYQYWETKTPSVDKIEQVAKVLGLTKDYFLGKGDEKNGTVTVQTTPKDQLRDILQTKAMVKTLLHEVAALRSKLTGEGLPSVLEDLHQKNMNHLIDLANQKSP